MIKKYKMRRHMRQMHMQQKKRGEEEDAQKNNECEEINRQIRENSQGGGRGGQTTGCGMKDASSEQQGGINGRADNHDTVERRWKKYPINTD